MTQTANLTQLLTLLTEQGGSDLHVTADSPPQLRLSGDLVPVRLPAMTGKDTKNLCYSILTENQKKKFEENLELDLSFGINNLARFRANIFMQRGNVAGAFRLIPQEIKPLIELGLPPIIDSLCARPRGLVLCTGPTGSGKSTTLASMIDLINSTLHGHIVTIEDPIEYLHKHKNCIINQRDVGDDTKSFKNALKYILRQDPDVVMIGEMRDFETIQAAITTAETGHLALATLHTNSALQTINRIIDAFPPHQQNQVRAQLSFALEGVISQTLLPKADGVGRVLAVEVMIPNGAIRNLIRENKVHQIYSQMQIGQKENQMQTMNQSLASLYLRRQITRDVAIARSSDPVELLQMIGKR